MSNENSKQKWALIFTELDNIILNNYWRKFYTYREIGWDEQSIKEYLSKKENIMKVASFNTTNVSFSASSRRNRYYNIYNKEQMLEQDVPYEGAVDGLSKLNEIYKIYIMTHRKKPLKEKTLEVMEKLGFNMDILTIYFMKKNKKLFQHRTECMKKIVEDFPSGVGICLNPSDKSVFERFNYTPIGFTSIKNYEAFKNSGNPFNIICQDWPQLLSSLNATD